MPRAAKPKSKARPKAKKKVEALTHEDASRKNIPTAEYEPVLHDKDRSSVRVAYERRNRDLDPQLVWRGKDEQDESDLVVHAPPLYIQEKVHPKVLIDDLRRQTEEAEAGADAVGEGSGYVSDLFADFNGLPSEDAKTEFYQHEANWSNRMILGDSLQVMTSLAEREGLRGKVQCIYFDPPYGIGFNSNFQWSTTSRSVKDGELKDITREPEQVKAFRDTWRDGVHSYLTYLRDRIIVGRYLLADNGSIFVQIGDENVHRVRNILDEVFGDQNFESLITFKKTLPLGSTGLPSISNYILWYAKDKRQVKRRGLYQPKPFGAGTGYTWLRDVTLNKRKMTSSERKDPELFPEGARPFFADNLMSSGYTKTCYYDVKVDGRVFPPQKYSWKTNAVGMERLRKADRLIAPAKLPNYIRYYSDFDVQVLHNLWNDTHGASSPVYIVQTSNKVVERCLLMSSDPGDIVLDPTCGSGTAAYIAEQWGRRWITIDTSRVALALARSRIMGAQYPYYLLADSKDGQAKDAELSHIPLSKKAVSGNIRHGFVCERIPHITLKSIANNSEIDVIWERYQKQLKPLLETLNEVLEKSWEEWEVPYGVSDAWPEKAKQVHKVWWEGRVKRQDEIDNSIASKADFENLYDRPYSDNKKVRVAGPFTVESLSPHRALTVDADDELIDPARQRNEAEDDQGFVQIILESLKTAGVQQADKAGKIDFVSLAPWPGKLVCAEGVYLDQDEEEKRAAILVGPEFGTVSRPDLVSAAREAADADFDVLIACAFNYDAHSTEFEKLGRVPVLKARMNADLHMADDLKNTGKGNLFVIFGEPDIDIIEAEDNKVQVKINGVDVFHPNTGEVRSDDTSGIACWFIDTDYDEESFFVRHAYFLGANDPYKALKTTLKTEINEEAWETLNSDVSRPFEKPSSGRIAVKVINHLGDEVMKVYEVR